MLRLRSFLFAILLSLFAVPVAFAEGEEVVTGSIPILWWIAPVASIVAFVASTTRHSKPAATRSRSPAMAPIDVDSLKPLLLLGNYNAEQLWPTTNLTIPGWLLLALAIVTGLLFVGLLFVWPWPQIWANEDWVGHKWDTATYDYWADVLQHPIEPEAGILATWGDLTSMWYMQQVEARRPDLYGIYPPEEDRVINWLKMDRPLYVGGPTLADWDVETLNLPR